MTISFAMGPIVAPFIGGYLQHYFGWQANFCFVGIYAVYMLLLVLLLPETFAKKTPFSPMHLIHNYRTILRSSLFVVGSILAGIAFSYSVLFSVAGPFIMVQVALYHSTVFYGHIALLMGVAWFAGNMLNRFLFDMVLSVRVRIALFFYVLGDGS